MVASVRQSLIDAVVDAARDVDSASLARVAAEIEALPEDADADRRRAAALSVVPADARDVVATLIDEWNATKADLTPVALAWALRSADAMDRWHRTASTTELVWTGPLAAGATLRQSDQALLELVNGAKRTIVVVSFAVYHVETVHKALLAAISRGVTVTFVFESKAESAGRISFDPLDALGPKLARAASVYVWPAAQRAAWARECGSAQVGLLHAKCAIADEVAMLVSSANFTENALRVNMEMGVLICGGALPRRAAEHIQRLIEEGVLCKQ